MAEEEKKGRIRLKALLHFLKPSADIKKKPMEDLHSEIIQVDRAGNIIQPKKENS